MSTLGVVEECDSKHFVVKRNLLGWQGDEAFLQMMVLESIGIEAHDNRPFVVNFLYTESFPNAKSKFEKTNRKWYNCESAERI